MQEPTTPNRPGSKADLGSEDASAPTLPDESLAANLEHTQSMRVTGISRMMLKTDGVPLELGRALRAMAPRTVQRITTQVQLEVSAYAGPTGGKRYRLVLIAVDKAVSHFVDVVERKPSPDTPVFELVRQLGQAEAIEGHSMDALRAAHHVATRVAWEEIREVAKERGVDPAVLSALVDALFLFIEQLINQVALGYSTASQGMESGSHHARRQLLNAMLSGHPPERYVQHLKAAGWHPPNFISVITGVLNLAIDYSALPSFGPEVLSGVSRHRMTLVAAPSHVDRLSRQMIQTPGINPVAISWVMPVTEVRDAYRWTCRALDLSARGLIDDSGIIDCTKYRSILWLHADPALSRHAGEELLAPLLKEKSHHRLVLAETMMLWLQARESAPVLAERMQVHHNTVRRRLRQLKDLFGDQLHDPQQTLALLSALEVSLPRWREQNRSSSSKRKKPS